METIFRGFRNILKLVAMTLENHKTPKRRFARPLAWLQARELRQTRVGRAANCGKLFAPAWR
jgi:hypothetical protein